MNPKKREEPAFLWRGDSLDEDEIEDDETGRFYMPKFALIPLASRPNVPFQGVLTPIYCFGRSITLQIMVNPKILFQAKTIKVPVIKIAINGSISGNVFSDGSKIILSFELLPVKDCKYKGKIAISHKLRLDDSAEEWIHDLWRSNWKRFAAGFRTVGDDDITPNDRDWDRLDPSCVRPPILYRCEKLPKAPLEIDSNDRQKTFLTMLLLCQHWRQNHLTLDGCYDDLVRVGVVRQTDSAKQRMSDLKKESFCEVHEAWITDDGPGVLFERILVPDHERGG